MPLVFVAVVSDMTIRSGEQQDIEQVLQLWEAAGSPPSVTDSEAGLRVLLATDPDALLVADACGVLLGSLIAAWDGWRASFYRLAVDPGRRREGIATALLHEGERRLRARGAIRLTAIVASGDTVATGFWQAAGYTRQPDQARFVRHAER
jgi:ribosomal protein S18 acetylase RimI-like enzyme